MLFFNLYIQGIFIIDLERFFLEINGLALNYSSSEMCLSVYNFKISGLQLEIVSA